MQLRNPIARTTDPLTSHEAAAELTRSGRRGTQAEQVLAVVRRWSGLTAGEIGEISGLGHVPAQRRLSDLERAGHIEKGEPRSFNGRRQVTWWVRETEGGPEQSQNA